MSIEKDNPLGGMLGGKKKGPDAIIAIGPEEDGEDGGDEEIEKHAAASAFIDAVHSKDPGAVADAFQGLYACMKSPGEDDNEMAPSSESGAEPEEDER
jgi:hypothetical protein